MAKLAIYKYPMPVPSDLDVLDMPAGARVLSVAVQDGVPCVWALVDPAAPLRPRAFAWRGTGHDASGLEAARFVGTVLMADGRLVFHLFEVA